MHIDVSHVSIPQSFFHHDDFGKLVYIYCLMSNGTPFYVGSSTNLASRYLHHTAYQTKDTKFRIAELYHKGIKPLMVAIDITDTAGRFALEGYYINKYAQKYELTNTTRYYELTKSFLENPKAYRSISQGNLTVEVH